MIAWTYGQARKLTSEVYVATDDPEIYNHVSEFGNAVITSGQHQSGTDRVKEAIDILGLDVDYVVNVQGDEPFIAPEQIQELIELLDGKVQIASQATYFGDGEDPSNPNAVKVVLNKNNEALYFSRSLIPYERQASRSSSYKYFRHIGIYAYRKDVLESITSLPFSTLEKIESLEQLRWLENGFRIKMGITGYHTPGIDTPEDLENARKEFFGKKFDV